jgi:hypothetical protein
MDVEVDNRLGDLILYQRPEDPQPVEWRAFLVFEEPAEGYQTRDVAKGIVRLRIRKQLFGEGKPSMNDRLTSPRLDGTYRPMAPEPTSAGRYWLVDLQTV